MGFELEIFFGSGDLPAYSLKTTGEKKMKMRPKVYNCQEGATQIWKIAAVWSGAIV